MVYTLLYYFVNTWRYHQRKDRASWNAIRAGKANSYRDARDTFEQSICFQKETYIYTDVILERDMKIDKLIELIFHIVSNFDFSFSNNFFLKRSKDSRRISLKFFFLLDSGLILIDYRTCSLRQKIIKFTKHWYIKYSFPESAISRIKATFNATIERSDF